MCKRLKWLRLSSKNKNKIINANIIPAALYGVETTHVSSQAMDGLRTAVAEILGPKSSKRSIDMLFNLSDKNKENDPKGQVLIKRIMELRRMMSKDPEILNMTQHMIEYYNDNQSAFDNILKQDDEENQEWINITNWKKKHT